jgi:hypothetical protein
VCTAFCAAEGMGLPKDQFSDAKLANMVKEEIGSLPNERNADSIIVSVNNVNHVHYHIKYMLPFQVAASKSCPGYYF